MNFFLLNFFIFICRTSPYLLHILKLSNHICFLSCMPWLLQVDRFFSSCIYCKACRNLPLSFLWAEFHSNILGRSGILSIVFSPKMRAELWERWMMNLTLRIIFYFIVQALYCVLLLKNERQLGLANYPSNFVAILFFCQVKQVAR